MNMTLKEQYIIQADAHLFVAAMRQTGPHAVEIMRVTRNIDEAQLFPDYFAQRINAVRKDYPHALYMEAREIKQRSVVVLKVHEPGGE